MAIETDSYSTIIERIRADVKKLLTELDPTIFASLIQTITDSNAGRHYDNSLSIKQLAKELFPDTAILANLKRWAAYEELTPFPSELAQGKFVATGLAGTTINQGTELRNEVGNQYTTDSDVIIELSTIPVLSVNRSGSTVTVVTDIEHNFATNLLITMAGAVETAYNGIHSITVLSLFSFSYEIDDTPTTPATGTITAECTCASTPITSVDPGEEQNLDSGATLTFVSTIDDVDSNGYVDFSAITGGQNEETADSLYNRTVQSRANPVANFNVAAIEKQALGIAGVTRVKVKRITPGIGDVTTLFVRDDDDNTIPSGAEVAEVKAAIVEILQATSEETNVIVTAPTPVISDYTFSSLFPDTVTMRSAVDENIKAMYEDEATFEQNITEDQYRSAIINTIDPDTGIKLSSFALTTPTGDIVVGTDSIGLPGNITF